MKTFNDNAGRTWAVALNIEAIRRVRTQAKVDLMDAVGGKLLEKLTTDPVLLCDILYAVCKYEADAKNVSDEDFGRALAGDAIDAATTALLEELVSFFPTEAKRRVLGKAMSKLMTLQTRALEVAELRLDSPELEKEMDQALTGNLGVNSGFNRRKGDRNPAFAELIPPRAPVSGNLSGSLPELLASTPAD